MMLLALDIAYNDLGGADSSCIVRNLLNAGLYLGFAAGATMIRVPLVVGDGPARWTIAITMTASSVLLPTFWRVALWGYGAPMVIGAVVVRRVIAKTTVAEDEITWKLWNLWMMSLYLLPYAKSISLA